MAESQQPIAIQAARSAGNLPLPLVLQIVVLLVVLIGLITIIMSIKNWHWAQMVLVLSIFFMSLATLFLGMETFRIHRNIRKAIPGLEKKIADLDEENRALQFGARNEDPAVMRIWTNEIFNGEPPYDAEAEGRMLSTSAWTMRLQDLSRARGRVWRNAIPGAFNQKTNQVAVTIAPQQQAPTVDPDLAAAEPPADPAAPPATPPAAQGHGLTVDAIVYAFENGAPNPGAPDQGSQYIGEFKVVQANDVGVILEPVQALNQFTGNRLIKSIQAKKSWSLYELMPADSHELFAKLDEAAKRALLPAATVNEYIRQGTPAQPDDDEFHIAYFDEANRLGPDDEAKATEKRYDRPLRDYGYLFPELMRERVVMEADVAALKQQIADLETAHANAKKLEAHRTAEQIALQQDKKSMERDLAFITKLLATINSQIANAKSQVSDLLTANASMAQSLVDKQLAELKTIDERSPAPAQRTLLDAQ